MASYNQSKKEFTRSVIDDLRDTDNYPDGVYLKRTYAYALKQWGFGRLSVDRMLQTLEDGDLLRVSGNMIENARVPK